MKLDWKDPGIKKIITITIIITVSAAVLMVVWRMLDDSGNILTQLGRLFSTIGEVLVPFILAAILAYIFLPFVRIMEERVFKRIFKSEKLTGLRRGLSVLISYALLMCLLGFMVWSIVPVFVDNIRDFVNNIPAFVDTIEVAITDFLRDNPLMGNQYISSTVQNTMETIQSEIMVITASVAQGVFRTIKAVTSAVSGIFITLIGSIYFLIDGERMKRSLKRFMLAVFGEGRAQTSFELTHIFDRVFGGYVRARLLETLIVGALVYILFFIFDIPYSALFAVINGILNLVPYFGPIVGWVITVAILLLINPVLALYAGIIVLVIQQFDGYVFGPKLMGDSLNLRPLYVMLSVTAGGAFFGVPGMLLMVPFVAFVGALLTRYINRRIGPAPEAAAKQGDGPGGEKKEKNKKRK